MLLGVPTRFWDTLKPLYHFCMPSPTFWGLRVLTPATFLRGLSLVLRQEAPDHGWVHRPGRPSQSPASQPQGRAHSKASGALCESHGLRSYPCFSCSVWCFTHALETAPPGLRKQPSFGCLLCHLKNVPCQDVAGSDWARCSLARDTVSQSIPKLQKGKTPRGPVFSSVLSSLPESWCIHFRNEEGCFSLAVRHVVPTLQSWAADALCSVTPLGNHDLSVYRDSFRCQT